MSVLLKNLQAASVAIDAVATAPGVRAFDRAEALIRLSRRVCDHLEKLSKEVASLEVARNSVSQSEGD